MFETTTGDRAARFDGVNSRFIFQAARPLITKELQTVRIDWNYRIRQILINFRLEVSNGQLHVPTPGQLVTDLT